MVSSSSRILVGEGGALVPGAGGIGSGIGVPTGDELLLSVPPTGGSTTTLSSEPSGWLAGSFWLTTVSWKIAFAIVSPVH
jgi:hypothetical protein